MKKYVKILRLDHWIKQLFIFPGVIVALVTTNNIYDIGGMILKVFIAFLSTCFVASSNYVINEWLDAEFDKYHPIKKHRSVVENNLDKKIVYGLYFSFAIVGFVLALLVSLPSFFVAVVLWIMGVFYNVRPIRTKDIPFVDVLSESVNNALRLLIGWFAITSEFVPPVSIVVGYWFAGAFLMATKRFSEFRMIGDKSQASLYRKSFAHYSEKSLLLSSFFYAQVSVFLTGIFLIKYRVELILFIPFYIGLFCYYFFISFKQDSAAQRPEKLYKEKGLIIYLLFIIVLFALLMVVDIPIARELTNCDLISIH